MKMFWCNRACWVKSAPYYLLQSCVCWEMHSCSWCVRACTGGNIQTDTAVNNVSNGHHLLSGIRSVNSSTTGENRTRGITAIGELMMWREQAKGLSIFTAILKTLTAEMYPSIPQHDLMIRAGSEGNGVCFHHQTLKAALIKVSSLLFRNRSNLHATSLHSPSFLFPLCERRLACIVSA